MKPDPMTITPAEVIFLRREKLAKAANAATEERRARSLLVHGALQAATQPHAPALAIKIAAKLLLDLADAAEAEEQAQAALARAGGRTTSVNKPDQTGSNN